MTNKDKSKPHHRQSPRAPVIVVGNEKGGSGKSTTAMHLIAGLLVQGNRVGALDLDSRQATLSRYLQNRQDTIRRQALQIAMPSHESLLPSGLNQLEEARREDEKNVTAAIEKLSAENDYIVIDTPGSDSFLSRAGHSHADILLTPLNDSFLDLDVLADIDAKTHRIKSPSQYAQMVFEQKITRAKRQGANRTFDWIVMRNRLGQLDSRNQKAMHKAIDALAKRIGFRFTPGFSERVIFRELFLRGLTLLDVIHRESGVKLSMSHLAARQEIRNLLHAIGLPVAGI